MFQITQIPLC